MKSILVTRFNWPHPSWNGDYGELYEAWIEERLDLFKRYTIPSIRNCHVKPDLWLILYSDFAKDIERRLTSILHGLNFELVRYRGLPVPDTIRIALKHISYPEEIRMTRVDSDDLISSDFFSRIKSLEIENDKAREGVTISFPGGANYVVDEDEFYFSSYPANPFITYAEFVESSEDLETVFRCMHIDMLSEAPNVRILRSYHPMWATIIHDKNLANDSLMATNVVRLSSKTTLTLKFGMRS